MYVVYFEAKQKYAGDEKQKIRCGDQLFNKQDLLSHHQKDFLYRYK